MYPITCNNVTLKLHDFFNLHFQFHIRVLINIQSLGAHLVKSHGKFLCRGELEYKHYSKPVVPKRSPRPQGIRNHLSGIRRYSSVMVTTSKLIDFLN